MKFKISTSARRLLYRLVLLIEAALNFSIAFSPILFTLSVARPLQPSQAIERCVEPSTIPRRKSSPMRMVLTSECIPCWSSKFASVASESEFVWGSSPYLVTSHSNAHSASALDIGVTFPGGATTITTAVSELNNGRMYLRIAPKTDDTDNDAQRLMNWRGKFASTIERDWFT